MRTISASAVQVAIKLESSTSPDDHFAATPDCRVQVAGSGCTAAGRSSPTVYAGSVAAAIVQNDTREIKINTAPDDHLVAGPHCRVITSAKGRAASACCRPTVRGGIVPAAGVDVVGIGVITAPHDHLGAAPDG